MHLNIPSYGSELAGLGIVSAVACDTGGRNLVVCVLCAREGERGDYSWILCFRISRVNEISTTTVYDRDCTQL